MHIMPIAQQITIYLMASFFIHSYQQRRIKGSLHFSNSRPIVPQKGENKKRRQGPYLNS